MAVLKVKDGSSSWHNIDSIKGDKGDTGTSIVSVTKTGSQGLIDIYTITFSDGTTTTFQVKNGENGQGSGSVTSVDTGVGLTGGAITSSGTIKADLVSDTYSTEASESITQTSGRQYAVNPDANGKLSVNVPWTDEGKTYTAGTNVQISSSNVISATDTTYESKTAASGGTAVSLVTTGEKYTWNQAEPNVQSDWNATSGDAKILNKPTNVSAFTNDAGYLTSFTETDPTVPSWAKQSSKPTYTASEVGALPDTTSIPSKTSDLTNDSNFVADASYVHTDNNYTSTEKSKLSGIAAGAEVNVQSDWNATSGDALILNKPTIPVVPTNVSAFTNDAGYITGYTETDPVFGASAASGITASHISQWNGITIGDYTENLADTITNGYTALPNNGMARAVSLLVNGGMFVGYMYRYSDTYGGGSLVKYDGTSCNVFIYDGAVTIKYDGVLIVNVVSFSTLPQTVSKAGITANHACIKAELGTPSAQTGDWTVTTSAGSLTISGSISGSTTAKLYLALQQ